MSECKGVSCCCCNIWRLCPSSYLVRLSCYDTPEDSHGQDGCRVFKWLRVLSKGSSCKKGMNVVIHQIYVGHSKAVFILLTRCIIRGKVGSKLCKVLTPTAPHSLSSGCSTKPHLKSWCFLKEPSISAVKSVIKIFQFTCYTAHL